MTKELKIKEPFDISTAIIGISAFLNFLEADSRALSRPDYFALVSLVASIKSKNASSQKYSSEELQIDIAFALQIANRILIETMEVKLDKTLNELRKIRDMEFA